MANGKCLHREKNGSNSFFQTVEGKMESSVLHNLACENIKEIMDHICHHIQSHSITDMQCQMGTIASAYICENYLANAQ